MKTLLILLLSLCSLTIFAQNDTLELYTKQGCGLCKWTKTALTKNQIAYAEYDLANDLNVDAMLKRLSAKGYKSVINLPVIFLNDSLIHPTTDTSLSLQHIVNTILAKETIDILNFAKSKNTVEQVLNSNANANAQDDCHLQKGEPQFVIIQYEFTEEQAALNLLNELHKQGYAYAGMVQSASKYRVFTQIFTSINEANAVLPDVQKKHKNAYVYVIQ